MALPLIIEAGKIKQADGDLDVAGTSLTLDSDNAGSGADVNIVANQGSDSDGTIRYNATDNRWELSNDGGTFSQIATGASGDTYDRAASFIVPEGDTTLEEANLGVATVDGSIVGLGVICGDDVTAGTITVTVKVGGTSTLSAVLSTVNPTKKTESASLGTHSVTAGDQITVEVVTASSYTNAASGATDLDVRVLVSNEESTSGGGGGGGSGSLDDAYNNGRTITVDNGAVVLDADVADTSAAMEITREPSSGSSNVIGLDVTVGSNVGTSSSGVEISHSAGRGLRLTSSGDGPSISISKGAATATTGNAINIFHGSNNTQGAVFINYQPSTAAAVEILNAGSQESFKTSLTGTGVGFSCSYSTNARGISLAATGVATNPVLTVNKSPSSASSGVGIDGTMGSNATGNFLEIDNDGSGHGVRIRQSGSGDALSVLLDSDTSASALSVSTSVATTSALVSLSNTSAGAGDVLFINKVPSSSAAGDGIDIDIGANCTGSGISLTNLGSGTAGINLVQSGSGDGIRVVLDSNTAAQGITVETSVNSTNSLLSIAQTSGAAAANFLDINKSPSGSAAGDGINLTMGSNTTGDGISITQDGSGISIDISHDSTTNSAIRVAMDGTTPSGSGLSISNYDGSGDAISVSRASGITGTAFRADSQAGTDLYTLTDAATIATDCSFGNVFQVTLGGNRTLGAPTNAKAGFTYMWLIKQDGTGSRTLSYNSVFKFAGGTAPTLSTGMNELDIISGMYDGTNFNCVFNADFS